MKNSAANQAKFMQICDAIIYGQRQRKGIGTLGEKSLHAVLKHYFEEDQSNHEVKWGGYVADILSSDGIIEIQTRGFDRLRKKLGLFLEQFPVMVVLPVPHIKWLIWMDPQTGETTNHRKSPKRGTLYELLPELYRIKSLLHHPNLRFCVVLMDMEEYRYLNGWSTDGKKGSCRHEMIPIGLVDEIVVNGLQDYIKLLPDGLCSEFSSKDFQKSSGLSKKKTQAAMFVLRSVGAIIQVGKRGNLILYNRNDALGERLNVPEDRA